MEPQRTRIDNAAFFFEACSLREWSRKFDKIIEAIVFREVSLIPTEAHYFTDYFKAGLRKKIIWVLLLFCGVCWKVSHSPDEAQPRDANGRGQF